MDTGYSQKIGSGSDGGDQQDATHEEACLGHVQCMLPPRHPAKTQTNLDPRAQADA